MQTQRISIIIPVYQAEDYLEDCLNTLLNQTYSDYEILLINDGSKDRSGEICNRYAQKNPQIRVRHQINAGASAARNTGLDIAQGAYICFVDADDKVSKHYLEKLATSLNQANSDLAICRITRKEIELDTQTAGQTVYTAEEALGDILEPTFFDGYVANKLYRRQIIEENHLRFQPDMTIWEDMLFCVQYLKQIQRISVVEERLYWYRDNPESQTAKTSLKKKKEQVQDSLLFLAEAPASNAVYLRKAKRMVVIRALIYARHLLLEPIPDVKEVRKMLRIGSVYVWKPWIPLKQKLKYVYLGICAQFCHPEE